MNDTKRGQRGSQQGEDDSRRTRVLIVDGRARVRLALRALLSTVPGLSVVSEVGDADQASKLTLAGAADAVVVDVMQLDDGGLEVVRRIKADRPMTRVVVLTADPWCRTESVRAGADAFVLKGCSLDELAAAITNGRVDRMDLRQEERKGAADRRDRP
jgi:two-component system NarL family response regulator